MRLLKSVIRNWLPAIVVPLAAIWSFVVWRSGRGWNPSGVDWNFENTGQLGDSFGVLSAGMAGIAAFYAFRTYQSARDDNRRIERQATASSFLNLLERRYDVLDRVRRSSTTFSGRQVTTIEKQGQPALDHFSSLLRRKPDEAEARFEQLIEDSYGLPNLFRFTYHIIAYADRELSELPSSEPMTKSDPAYQNVRLLRAQMSDAELLLIALNCAYGNGREKFKPLIERYAFLHNMNPKDISDFGIRDLFKPEALGFESDDQDRTLIVSSEPEGGAATGPA